ncbi:MAG: DUF1684 domain-containing protein [Chitinophagaceae bacterium]|nr:DUF1684 domain-containing protein [Chitinophagaceae bacterium]
MKKIPLLLVLFLIAGNVIAQKKSYTDSIEKYLEKYAKEHEVVKGKDKDLFRFFPVNESYRVKARFEKVYNFGWFDMETSGKQKQTYRIYGILHFTLHDTALKLYVYQSQQLMNTKEYGKYLFAPFTDKTCGTETYENGRYLDLTTDEVTGDSYTIDFNKAYNPYCAYISNVFNCPIPPKENDLPVAVRSGEMKFAKAH